MSDQYFHDSFDHHSSEFSVSAANMHNLPCDNPFVHPPVASNITNVSHPSGFPPYHSESCSRIGVGPVSNMPFPVVSCAPGVSSFLSAPGPSGAYGNAVVSHSVPPFPGVPSNPSVPPFHGVPSNLSVPLFLGIPPHPSQPPIPCAPHTLVDAHVSSFSCPPNSIPPPAPPGSYFQNSALMSNHENPDQIVSNLLSDPQAVQSWLNDWSEQLQLARRADLRRRSKRRRYCSLGSAGMQSTIVVSDSVVRRSVCRRRRSHSARSAKRRERASRLSAAQRADVDTLPTYRQDSSSRKHQMDEVKPSTEQAMTEADKNISDLDHLIQLVESLTKLRQIRAMKASQRSGGRNSSSCEQQAAQLFSETCVQQLQLLEQERRRLHVLVEKRKAEAGDSSTIYTQDAWTVLFGDEMPSGPDRSRVSPLHEAQWCSTPKQLVQTRFSWDRYVTTAENPFGSAIPPTWVVPVAPSSGEWAKYIVKSDRCRV